MLNLENKRQIIIVVSSNVVFPSQIVFISITFITFPPNNRGKKIASEMVGTSFLVKTIGHILKTIKIFFTNILLPYMQSQIQILGLNKE
jgi:hypothetical protein